MKQDYITTNIRLPRSWHKELKLQAARQDKSLATLIREAVKKYMMMPVKADNTKE